VDIALAEELSGEVRLHRADCPYLATLVDLGRPVFTLFGVHWDGSLLPEVERHSCLTPLN
jgi:hypothetical protein